MTEPYPSSRSGSLHQRRDMYKLFTKTKFVLRCTWGKHEITSPSAQVLKMAFSANAQWINRVHKYTVVNTCTEKRIPSRHCAEPSFVWAAITKVSWPGWLKQHLFLTVLKAGNFKIKVLADSLSAEDLFPGSERAIFSLCTYLAEVERELSRVSFTRALILFMRAPPYDLIPSQRPHPLIPS